MRNDISLVLFTSTKQHFNSVITYQETVDSLLTQVPAGKWGQLLSHIQITPGDERIADEMTEWLESKGFEVYETTGEWRHHDQSHHKNYLLCQIKMSQLVRHKYYLHLEDDMVLKVNKKEDYSLSYLFDVGKCILDLHPEILEMRFPRFNNEIERLKNIKAKHGIDANIIEADDMKQNGYFYHADNANFHPSIRRSRDMYISAKIVEDNLDRLSYNCEHGFSTIFKMLSREKSCLACFYPDITQCLHIGVRAPEERDVAGQVFDK